MPRVSILQILALSSVYCRDLGDPFSNLRVLQVSHKEGKNRPDRFTKLTGNQFRSALKIPRLLPGNQIFCFSAAWALTLPCEKVRQKLHEHCDQLDNSNNFGRNR